MSEFEDYDECEEEDPTEEDVNPETCSMGMFSPGTEMCDFCSWADVCAEELAKALKR